MKSICFIIRDGYDAKFIIQELSQRGLNGRLIYIIEKGSYARRQKLKRMIRRQHLWNAFINGGALLVYDHIMQKRMKILCGNPSYPSQCEYVYIDDVNEPKCRQEVVNRNPDFILIYGSGILKPETIRAFGKDIYNIHSSVLPYYRNVHSDFWAYMDDRKDLIGVTIFQLDAGIDTGNIAFQYRCRLAEQSQLYEYKAENLKHIPGMIEELIEKFDTNSLILQPQNWKEGSVAVTPNLKDIICFFKKESRKSLQ